MKDFLILGFATFYLLGAAFAQKSSVNSVARSNQLTKKSCAKTTLNTTTQNIHLELERTNLYLMASKKSGENEYALQADENEPLEVGTSEKQITSEVVEKHFIVAEKGAAGPQKQLQPSLDADKIKSMYVFKADPTIVSNFQLKMGVGSAKLNFADIPVENVAIKGGYSDIWIDFAKLNKKKLSHFDLHNAAGNITLRYPENANAEVIHIQNDMSEIKLIVGKSPITTNNCVLKTIKGSIWLNIDKTQPIKLIVKKGLMATFNPPKGYTLKSEDVYINETYLKNPNAKCLTITCTTDLGTIEVIEE